MLNIVYALAPEELGYEPGSYVLLEKSAAERAAAAFRCETWGEYARLHGLEWSEAIEEWDLDNDSGSVVSAGDSFDYADLFYAFDGPAFADPQEVAYDWIIPRLDRESYQGLSAALTISHGSPAGHTCSIVATNSDGVRRLQSVLEESAPAEFMFEEDADLVLGALGLLR